MVQEPKNHYINFYGAGNLCAMSTIKFEAGELAVLRYSLWVTFTPQRQSEWRSAHYTEVFFINSLAFINRTIL